MSSPSISWGLEGDDVILGVHHAALNLGSWPPHNVELVEELNNAHLRLPIRIHITDSDIALGLEVGHVEFEELGVNAQIGNVMDLSKAEGRCLHSN